MVRSQNCCLKERRREEKKEKENMTENEPAKKNMKEKKKKRKFKERKKNTKKRNHRRQGTKNVHLEVICRVEFNLISLPVVTNRTLDLRKDSIRSGGASPVCKLQGAWAITITEEPQPHLEKNKYQKFESMNADKIKMK